MNFNNPRINVPYEEPPPAYHDEYTNPSVNTVTFRYTSTDSNAQTPQNQQPIYPPSSSSSYITSMNGPMPDPYQQHSMASMESPYQNLVRGSFGGSSNSQQQQQHISHPSSPISNNNQPNSHNNVNNNNDDGFLFVHHGQPQQQPQEQDLSPRNTHSMNNNYGQSNFSSPQNPAPISTPLFPNQTNAAFQYHNPTNHINVNNINNTNNTNNNNNNNNNFNITATNDNNPNIILDENDPDYDPFLVLNALQTLSQPPSQTQYPHNHNNQSTSVQSKTPSNPPKPKKDTPTVTSVTDLILSGQLIPPMEDFECPICAEMTFMEFFQQEFAFLGCFPGEMDEFRAQCPALQLSTCLHTFCFSCLTAYVTNYIESDLVQAQVKRIPCMEADCGAWITQTELRAILTKAEYERFEQQQLEWSSLGQENMYKCITPNCPAIIEKAGDLIGDERTGCLNPKLICPQCRIPQCVQCGIAWHMNQTCKEYKAKLAEQEAVKNSALLGKAADFDASSPQFRQCPQCKITIEKVTGCDKVKCLCGYGMCWVCGSPGAKCQCTKGNHVFYDNATGHGTRTITNK